MMISVCTTFVLVCIAGASSTPFEPERRLRGTTANFTVVSKRTGCRNFASLPQWTFTNVSNGICARMCAHTVGCNFWTYQDEPNDACARSLPKPVQPPVGDDSCTLFVGHCDKEDNACWDVVTLSTLVLAPAPPAFTVVAERTGCKNIASLPQLDVLTSVSNAQCAQKCAETSACSFWTYQDEPNDACTSAQRVPPPVQPPTGDDACILFGGLCVREENACWDVVTLSGSPSPFAPKPPCGPIPAMVCGNPSLFCFADPTCLQGSQAGCNAGTGFEICRYCGLGGGTPECPSAPTFTVVSERAGCKNFASLPQLAVLTSVSNGQCAIACAGTLGCAFWTYQDEPNDACTSAQRVPPPVQPPTGDDACILFGGLCVKEENACWDVVTLSGSPSPFAPAPAPTPPAFTVIAERTGCKNVASLHQLDVLTSVSNAQCAIACAETSACSFWTYQDEPNDACAAAQHVPLPVQPPIGDDACVLFGGECARETNPCWELVRLTS